MERVILKISLIISFLGVFLLLFLAEFLPAKKVFSYQDLRLDERAEATGKIISIKNFEDLNIIRLDSNITATCSSCYFKLNQKIRITGKVSKYENQLQINAESIKLV